MQLFILRAVKPKKDDLFGLFSNDEYTYFFCKGLKDLRATIRHITPRGYRVRTPEWFSKYLKIHNYDLVLETGFFGMNRHETYRIIKVELEPSGYEIFDYKNRSDKTYPLKSFANEDSINNIKSLFK
ncbi:hypothetical protein [Sphingobacterium anhuiense]|uniref:hypothetical protein n=1 Tax=Sphingobacterium anhuiense TaxID=493780 RepID=UPI003C30AF9A